MNNSLLFAFATLKPHIRMFSTITKLTFFVSFTVFVFVLFANKHFNSFPLSNLMNLKNCGWITAVNDGRLGNQMYMYASLYGISKHNKKKPFLMPSITSKILNETFESLSIPVIQWNLTEFPLESPPPPCCTFFSPNVMNLNCSSNVLMTGELQSHKHFLKYWNEIRKDFKFRKDIWEQCQKSIHEIPTLKKGCTIIGVHLRRGDFATSTKMSYGHWPARNDLVIIGMKYFYERLNTSKCLQFVILGDDYAWNIAHSPNSSDVIVLKPNTAAVDFCILSHVNHSIISTGTFSIMSALLAGGTTLYQKEQARPGSELDRITNVSELIPNDWIPI